MAASQERFSVHDFGPESWAATDAFGDGVDGAGPSDHLVRHMVRRRCARPPRVVDLLPSLPWEGTLGGPRVGLAAIDAATPLANFREEREWARANIRPGANGGADYPTAHTLRHYLTDNLRREHQLRYYILDRAQFGAAFEEAADFATLLLTLYKGRRASTRGDPLPRYTEVRPRLR
jgi:hypothetical protein